MTNNKPESSLNGFYVVLGIIAVVGLGLVGYKIAAHPASVAVTAPAKGADANDPAELAQTAKGVTMGDPNAPVTIVVFEDYMCPHCAEFSTRVRPEIEKTLIDPGKAKLVYHDFPLQPGAGSVLAARAARCANDQGKFWDYQEVLFSTQSSWVTQQDKEPALVSAAQGIGLDAGKFQSCLDSDRHADQVNADLALAKALGLDGTPSVLVGATGGMGRKLSNWSLPALQAAVEAATPK